MHKLDAIFINSNALAKTYQELATNFAAIEPPTWSLLLAESCRNQNFCVDILDCDAEKLNNTQAIARIQYLDPRLCCFVVYGQNPNSGTTNMEGNLALAKEIWQSDPTRKIMFIGSHVSALPQEILSFDYINFISYNEGVKCLLALLKSDLKTNLDKIPALGWKKDGFIKLNPGQNSLVSKEEMDILMPGYAWDLLPYKEKPLDLYRSHVWHPNYVEQDRTPFAALYTSLGCQFKCLFCMINIVNRTDIAETATASSSSGMRYWSPEWVGRQFDTLLNMGVSTIRISDEMFFLNKKYYEPILTDIINKGYGETIKTWSYSRVDTVNEKFLELFKNAGMKWLALGIESANQTIRQEITKGKFRETNIRDIVKLVESHGMNVVSNFIFGFPNEKKEHLQQTLDLAIDLDTAFANMYCATALPGSDLYLEALKNKWKLPTTYSGYGFLSYDHIPLRTNYLTAAEVLEFRDKAWHTYYERPEFLKKIESKFGVKQKEYIQSLSKIRLKRGLLENALN